MRHAVQWVTPQCRHPILCGFYAKITDNIPSAQVGINVGVATKL